MEGRNGSDDLLTTTMATTTTNSSESDWSSLISLSKMLIEGVGILSFGVVGLFINAFALFVLIRKRVLRNFHLLMCSLALYDFLQLICGLLCFALPHFSQHYKRQFLLPAIPIIIPITQIALTASCYTTVAITVERFFSIRKPFFIQRHNIKARLFLVPVIFYAILFNIPRFFEFQVDYEDDKYVLRLTQVRKNKLYISLYVNTLSFLSNLIVPFATMGLLNFLIWRAMRAGNATRRIPRLGRGLRRSCEHVLRKREARITRASVAITAMFVACHWPRCVPNLVEMFLLPPDFPWWLPVVVSLNHLLITLNSAFNFLFYLSYCRATTNRANKPDASNAASNPSKSRSACVCNHNKRCSDDASSSFISAFNELHKHQLQMKVHFQHHRRH